MVKSIIIKRLLFIFIFAFFILSSAAQNCAANAGIDKSICVNQPLTLTGVAGNPKATTPAYLWSQVSGPSSIITTPAALSTSITSFSPGNYVFQFSNKCADNLMATNLISITVSPFPQTSLAGNDTSICVAAPVQLSANPAAAPLTGTWTVLPNIGSFSPNVNAANATYTPVAGPNTYNLTWTIANGNCTASSSKILKVISASAVSAGVNQTISCAGNCAKLAGSNPGVAPPQTGIWSQVSGPASPVVFSNPNAANSTVCNLVAGTYVFRWTVSGPCVNNAATVTITVNNVFNAPLGSDYVQYQSFCDTPPVTFQALNGSALAYGETGSWVQLSGGAQPYPNVNFVPNNTGSSVAVTGMTGLFPYTFRYIKSNAAGCTINGTHIVYRNPGITHLSTPVNKDLACNVVNTSFTLTYDDANAVERGLSRIGQLLYAPNGASGTATYNSSSNPATAGTGTRTDLWMVTGLTVAGSYIFRMEYKNGCGIQNRDIIITVSKTPGALSTGSSIVLTCNKLFANLVAAANNPVNLTWSQISGPNTAVLAGANSTSLTMTGLDSGLYKMRLTNTGGTTCAAYTSDVLVLVSRAAPTIANTGPNSTICYGNYKLSANIPKANETGTWSVMPSAGINFLPNINTPKAYATGLLPNTVYTFTWTVSNTCGSLSSNQLLITNNTPSPPIPNAGTDICMTAGSATSPLAGNNPGTALVLWTALTPGSTVASATSQNTTANFTGGSGAYLFQYALSTPGCSTFTDTVAITVNTIISPVNAGSNQDICSAVLPASTTLTATPAPPAGTTAIWTQISGPAAATIANANAASTAISNLVQGIYEFEYRIHKGLCLDVFDTVVVRVAQQPTDAYAGPDQSICNTTTNTTVTLAATAAVAGNGFWEVSSSPPGSNTANFAYSLTPNNTSITNLTAGAYILKWSTFNGPGCPVKTSLVTLNINAVANAGPDISLCDKTTTAVSGSPNTDGSWAFVSGVAGATVASNTNSTAVVNGLTAAVGGNQFIYSYTIAATTACPGSTDNMTITNFAAPVLVDAGPDQLLCSNISTVTLTGNAQTAGVGSWSQKRGPNTPAAGTANESYQDTTLNNLIAGLYVYQYIINTNAACVGAGDSVQIIKEAAALVLPVTQRFCNASTINLTGNQPVAHTATWSFMSGPTVPTFTNINNPVTAVNGLVPGTYVFRWAITGEAGCPDNSADVQIIIDMPVTAVNAGADNTFCEGSIAPFSLGTAAVTGLTYSWSPATLLNDNTLAQPTFTGTGNAGNYTYTLEADNGSCKAFDVVNITVIPKPGANINVSTNGCAGTFSATDVGSGIKTPVNYDWVFGNSTTATPATANGAGPWDVVFANGNSKAITLNVSSADGCSNSKTLSYQPVCPLPITLLSFTANYNFNFVLLQWKVTDVINFKKFEIQRSEDGHEFTTINTTDYLQDTYEYNYQDNLLPANTVKLFYRLKLVDEDGFFKYSATRVVTPLLAKNLSASPNPFVNTIYVAVKPFSFPQKIIIKLINILGDIVLLREINLTAGQQNIKLNNLDNILPGNYTLQLNTDFNSTNYKVVKL